MKGRIRVKVLQVNVVFQQGSTGKVVADIHTVLRQRGHDSVVCYGRGLHMDQPDVYKSTSELEAKLTSLYTRISGLPYSGAFYSTGHLINIIKKEQPDLVHLHCINGNMVNIKRLLVFLKTHAIKTVLTLHAEFMYTGGCDHAYDCEKWKTGCGQCPRLRYATRSVFFDRTHQAWQRMADAFSDFQHIVIVSVSPWLDGRAKQSPFLKDKTFTVIGNGIDTQHVFHPVAVVPLKQKLQLDTEKIVLHVTVDFSQNTQRNKGGAYVVELAARFKQENVKFIVVGSRNTTMELPNNIINVGRVENQHELAAYYSLADLTLLTSKRETFSMVAAESLACGTPVVGFKAGGPETIALPDYSEFAEYGDVDALESMTRQWITKKAAMNPALQQSAMQHYGRETMADAYLAIYDQLVAG